MGPAQDAEELASEGRRWVLLCECWDVAELHTVRACLEAHGLPVRVQGEQTHGVMGMLHGATVRSRILVPQAGLTLARELAQEVMGPFADGQNGDDAQGSPFRREGQPTLAQRPHSRRPRRRKRLITIGIISAAALFFPITGLAHLYVARYRRGAVLLVCTLFAHGVAASESLWGISLMILLLVLDAIGGGRGVLEYNLALAQERKELGLDDEDDDEDEDEDDDEDEELAKADESDAQLRLGPTP